MVTNGNKWLQMVNIDSFHLGISNVFYYLQSKTIDIRKNILFKTFIIFNNLHNRAKTYETFKLNKIPAKFQFFIILLQSNYYMRESYSHIFLHVMTCLSENHYYILGFVQGKPLGVTVCCRLLPFVAVCLLV